jgi:hypothetical protein
MSEVGWFIASSISVLFKSRLSWARLLADSSHCIRHFSWGGQVHDMHDICLDWKTSLMAVRAVLRPDNPHPLNPP